MLSIFSYLSAEVDWCEGNFERSTIIAEYYNTSCFWETRDRTTLFSLFLLIPLKLPGVGGCLHGEPFLSFRTLLTQSALFLAGVFSMYFHMTLSYVGQLLDELSILWTLAVAYSFWYPKVYFPRCIKNRKHFLWLSGVITVVSTLMSFIKPAFNAYVLNCIAFHLLYLTWRELKKCKDKRVHRMAAVMVMWWGLAITSWIADKWLCSLWQTINFPYFHSFWHVLIAISLLYCCPLVIYFNITYEMPSFKPKLEYWPSNSWPVVVPYVALEQPHKQC
ncbi:Alkaline ceramidase 1 [Struthio camelus australis]|uniref:Alkaline ceramidase n=1 Tax=Struthio camelus australis TaxID=441894 RepID=A0A093HE00_STRCA|nr:Alkaline ceramidase 1 [Struthio camelus australis]